MQGRGGHMQRGGRGTGQVPQTAADREMVELLKPPTGPKPYLVRRNDKMVINADLFEQRARAIAEELVAANLNNTQLRRFFSPIVELKNKVLAGAIYSAELKAELALLKARAAYAKKRPGVKVPDALVRLFTDHAHWVDDGEELLAFARHFEAIVAYHRALTPSRQQEESA